MSDRAATIATTRLSGVGQLYVTTVGAVAVLTVIAESSTWYVALVLLALPLSLLALWVSFYAGVAIGFVVGSEASELPWPVALVWVLVWTMTAWLNAQLGQKVRRKGWAAVAPRRGRDHDQEWLDAQSSDEQDPDEHGSDDGGPWNGRY